MIVFTHKYEEIISIDNLLSAWQEFIKGKRKKKDVQEFQLRLMDNIIDLHTDLKNKTYKHGGYHAFNISDPKPRNIHKASVRDRLLHHAIYRILYPYFDKKFIHDSYSCRIGKGTHRAIKRFNDFARKVSRNNTRTCWVLKCDIRKFFASIDQNILLEILKKHIIDQNIIWLLGKVIGSFQTACHSGESRNPDYSSENLDTGFRRYDRTYLGVQLPSPKGLPLGNLTSQLLVNIYMNEFDQCVKHIFKVKHYIRYADDFVILNEDKNYLLELVPKIADFLSEELKLTLHPTKLFIKTIASGIDFFGWVNFPNHRVLRTATKRRMPKSLRNNPKEETVAAYLGMMRWGNTHKIKLMCLAGVI